MSKPPIRAELFWKRLTSNELLLSLAMLENSKGTGECIWVSIDRLAAYTKLDSRTVQRLIHGYVDQRDGNRRRGLLERGIILQLAPANWTKKTTATYRFNLDALDDDPSMERYQRPWLQQTLPGIRRPAINGEPITGDTVSPDGCHRAAPPVSQCHPPSVTVSPNSRAFDSVVDSKSLDSRLSAVLTIPEISPKLAARQEQERRDGLIRARKAGLRDYSRYPLELWEQEREGSS